MKQSSIKSLLLVSAFFTPWLHAQDPEAKILEIEQKVLLEQYHNAVRALIGSASEAEGGETGVSPDLISKRLQWLGMVDAQLEAAGKTPAANPEDMAESAAMLNSLAWKLVTSPDAGARQPEIARKLATLALELGGEDWSLKPNVLDTKARALFLLGRRDEAVVEQQKAVAAATAAEQKAELEATLAAYKTDELPKGTPEVVTTGSGIGAIMGKLRTIVIPSVELEDVTLAEAVAFLRQQSIGLDKVELDPARKGVNFVVRRPRPVAGPAAAGSPPAEAPPAPFNPDAIRINSLHLRNVPLEVALKYICDAARLRYKVDDYAVTMLHLDAPEDLFNRTFQVPPDFAAILSAVSEESEGKESAEATEGAAGPATRPSIIELLRRSGVNFGEGSSVTLTPSGMLLVTNTPTEMDKIEQLIVAMTE